MHLACTAGVRIGVAGFSFRQVLMEAHRSLFAGEPPLALAARFARLAPAAQIDLLQRLRQRAVLFLLKRHIAFVETSGNTR